MSERKIPFSDKVRAKVYFELGSWISRKVRPVGKFLFGDQPIPQWYVTNRHANDLAELGVKVDGDPNASGNRRSTWTRGVHVEGAFPATRHSLYGTAEEVGRKPAVCVAVGKAVVAALIPNEGRSAILALGHGDLEAGVGRFNVETRDFQLEHIVRTTLAPLAQLQADYPQTPRM